MFKADPEKEVTQVEFWMSYKETFTPYASKHAPLVYAQAQAMAPGPSSAFRYSRYWKSTKGNSRVVLQMSMGLWHLW